MKKLIFIGFSCLILTGCISTEKIKDIPPYIAEYSITNNKPFFNISLFYFADTTKNSRSTITFKDEITKTIKGSIITPLNSPHIGSFDFSLIIYEDKIVLTCNEFFVNTEKKDIYNNDEYQKLLNKVKVFADNLFYYFDTL